MGVIAPKDNIGKKQLDNRVQVEISGSHPLVVCSPLDWCDACFLCALFQYSAYCLWPERPERGSQ